MTTKEVKNELLDLKTSINFMGQQLGTIADQQRTIMGLMTDMQELRMKYEEQQKRINFLETRVADLEQYTRINDVIISGIPLKPTSYAHALKGDQREEGTDEHDSSTEAQVTHFLENKDIHVDRNDIEACHPLPSRNPKAKPVVIVRFSNRKSKKLKGTDVYINEHLSKTNADLARRARFLKKDRKVQATWTSNCRVYIKTNGGPEEAKVICIRSSEQLENLHSHRDH